LEAIVSMAISMAKINSNKKKKRQLKLKTIIKYKFPKQHLKCYFGNLII
jgi:hypothetical protein